MDDANTTTVETPFANPEAAGAGAAPDLLAQLDAVTAERDRLAAEKASLDDLLMRRQADLENYRRRVEREKSETREFASMDATQSLLPLLDDFERALRAAPSGYEEGPVSEYTKGMELIYRRLLDTLTKLGLEPIAAQGQPFDPNLHNAIQKEERSDVEDQTVLEEYQRGYYFKGRLLRPSMVKVAVKS